MTVEVARRRFTVSEYHRLAETGILGPEDRVELIEGELIQMSPIGRKHAAGVTRLNNLFCRRLGPRALVSPQNPVTLGSYSEPQPDLMLLRPRDDCYEAGHPTPEDVLLLIEVSDTSLRYDREVKVPLYARQGIREVWLVDIGGEALEVYRDPTPDGYLQSTRLTRGKDVTPLSFPDLTVTVDELLG